MHSLLLEPVAVKILFLLLGYAVDTRTVFEVVAFTGMICTSFFRLLNANPQCWLSEVIGLSVSIPNTPVLVVYGRD